MKNDKTKTYSDIIKTNTYGDSAKLITETIHNIKVGNTIVLNNTEYKIIELISESTGEAVIYKIEDAEQKAYALKLYFELKDSGNEPNAEALSRIKNIEDEDILKLIDFGIGINKYKGKYCFEISDFAQGFNLLSVESLKKKYTLNFIEKELIPQIFKGILRLHNNKIYHCDLKPQNVFYLDKEQKEIVIGDYGSAKTFEFDAEKKSRKTTTVKGTDFYLPPEQARGFISEKNDYYSFGMILLHIFYPEKILLNENEPESISHSKLKQLIERQFEVKPVIEYNQKYERINKLIEGLILVDFNLRWGKEQVEKWLKGEQIEVTYIKNDKVSAETPITKGKALNFGKYTINTVYDLKNYILNDEYWYEDLVEDKDNWREFINWVTDHYKGDKRKSSTLNRIVGDYSQEGIDYISEAFIRFFMPEQPVIFGFKSFNFAESSDLKKITAHAFSHLINDLWETSSDKEIKLCFFRFEFALMQLVEKQEEVINLLKVLYKELNATIISTDFHNHKASAHTFISYESLNNIKKFLLIYLPSSVELDLIKLKERIGSRSLNINGVWHELQNKMYYRFKISISDYYTEIGIKNVSVANIVEDYIYVNYPEYYISKEIFLKKTIDAAIRSICEKYLIPEDIFSESNMEIFKKDFINAYNQLFEKLKLNLAELKNNLPKKIKQNNTVKKYLKEIESVISEGKFHKMNTAYHLTQKVKRFEVELKEKLIDEGKRDKYEIESAKKKSRSKTFNIISIIFPFVFLVSAVIWTEFKPYIKSLINFNKNHSSAKIEMIQVKGGTFDMGNDMGMKDEIPSHTVNMESFYISKYEITNEQFCLFLNNYGSEKVKEGDYKGEQMIYLNKWGINFKDNSWLPRRGYENYPVIYVTWFGANEYCKWANGRLPTEAEWEFAAKGGNKSRYYKYSGSDNIKDVAWYYPKTLKWYEVRRDPKTHEIGTKQANELGIFDMSGNVWEWCEDWYDGDYYSYSTQHNPVNLKESKSRVMRGGSYNNYSRSCLLYNRLYDSPDKHFNDTGFRLCKDKDINNKEFN